MDNFEMYDPEDLAMYGRFADNYNLPGQLSFDKLEDNMESKALYEEADNSILAEDRRQD